MRLSSVQLCVICQVYNCFLAWFLIYIIASGAMVKRSLAECFFVSSFVTGLPRLTYGRHRCYSLTRTITLVGLQTWANLLPLLVMGAGALGLGYSNSAFGTTYYSLVFVSSLTCTAVLFLIE